MKSVHLPSMQASYTVLTQIKLNLSPSKSQLFKYNLTDNPFCPSCGDSVETPVHYFIECNAHHANPPNNDQKPVEIKSKFILPDWLSLLYPEGID